jgi:hypothetical protein
MGVPLLPKNYHVFSKKPEKSSSLPKTIWRNITGEGAGLPEDWMKKWEVRGTGTASRRWGLIKPASCGA